MAGRLIPVEENLVTSGWTAGRLVVTVNTGEGVAGDEVGAAEVTCEATTCVTAGCAVCWLTQPEQKNRIKQAAMMAIEEIVFMISFVVEVIFSSIRFLDHSEEGIRPLLTV